MEKEQSSNFQVVLDEATRVKDSYGVTRLKMLCGGQRMLSDNFATTITDEFMQQRLARSKDYSIVILKAGVFIYEIHPCSSFPGDSLPE